MCTFTCNYIYIYTYIVGLPHRGDRGAHGDGLLPAT